MRGVWSAKRDVTERVKEDRGETWHSLKWLYEWIKKFIDIRYCFSIFQDGA